MHGSCVLAWYLVFGFMAITRIIQSPSLIQSVVIFYSCAFNLFFTHFFLRKAPNFYVIFVAFFGSCQYIACYYNTTVDIAVFVEHMIFYIGSQIIFAKCNIIDESYCKFDIHQTMSLTPICIRIFNVISSVGAILIKNKDTVDLTFLSMAMFVVGRLDIMGSEIIGKTIVNKPDSCWLHFKNLWGIYNYIGYWILINQVYNFSPFVVLASHSIIIVCHPF